MALLVPAAGHPAAAEDFVGEFETHVTVEDGAERLSALGRWAAERELKLTHIVLARGRVPSQPMLTLRGTGALPEQRAAALAVVRDLRASGFRPVRVKIEATPWARGVPERDADAVALGPGFYFEHHLKVLLATDADRAEPAALAVLAALIDGHTAHVSWNARRTDAAGRQHRFVTQRCHGVGLPAAGARLAALVAAVAGAGIEIASVEREFVVHDSNLGLDEGWIAADGR